WYRSSVRARTPRSRSRTPSVPEGALRDAAPQRSGETGITAHCGQTQGSSTPPRAVAGQLPPPLQVPALVRAYLIFSARSTRIPPFFIPLTRWSSMSNNGKIDPMDQVRGCWVLVFLTAAGLAQSTGTFTPAGNMTTPRVFHTATLLTTGKILIIAGNDGPS